MKNFLITLLFGMFGVHKFMQGKTGMGILYLLTLGLFGVGWMVDCFTAFCSIGKANSTAIPIQTHSQQLTGEALRRRLQIIDDCMTLIHSTNNADVFFPRYDLLLKTLIELGDLETHDKWQLSKQENIRSFIIRNYNASLIRADSKKTEKAKYNQFLKSYESIEKYRHHLSDDTAAFFENKFAPQLYGA